MLSDYNAMLDEALQRILRANELRYQLALGRKPETANRSVGQLWGKRWGHKRFQPGGEGSSNASATPPTTQGA